MEQMTEQELNARINSFITKKAEQYPELALRGREKRAQSIGHLLADKVSEFVSHTRMARLTQ